MVSPSHTIALSILGGLSEGLQVETGHHHHHHPTSIANAVPD